MDKLTLTSPVFEGGGAIPAKYTCDGDPPAGGVNPPLEISGIPEGTKSLALIMDDPDIPDFVKQKRGIEVFDHWVVFNIGIENEESGIKNLLVEEGKEPEGIKGKNSAGGLGYTGPCPPDKEHRYFFKLYALNSELDLPEGATKRDVEKAMEGKIIDQTELMGTYEREV